MTTKVDPTVDKWGGDQETNKCEFCGETKPVQRYYLRVKNKHFDDNKGGCYSTFIYYCQDCGIEDTHSVQEAKAERDRLWERAWIMYFFEKGDVPAKEAREIIKKYVNFFEKSLASLKQEEDL